jgi:hypothetical protein
MKEGKGKELITVPRHHLKEIQMTLPTFQLTSRLAQAVLGYFAMS